MKTQRKYKDTVYRMFFKDPGRALSLYNSLNGTDYTDRSLLEFNTLENAIYMGMKNDLSFLIMDQLNLYEHQSTFTRNMPLRNLLYAADLLHVLVKDESLYSAGQIKLPTPHFVVLYNGTDSLPERMELKLSDAYKVPTRNPELELKVQVLNINPGMNEELKAKCPALREYADYVEKVRNRAKTMPLEEAVEGAVDECIREGIMRDFLLQQKAEVVKMSIYEWDAERDWELLRKTERKLAKRDLRDEVKAEVREEMEANLREEMEANLREEMEAESLQKNIATIISLCKEFGSTKEETADKLMDRCGLGREQAHEQVERLWEN